MKSEQDPGDLEELAITLEYGVMAILLAGSFIAGAWGFLRWLF